MAESHDFDEAIFGEPAALLHHVIEHHRDLRHRPADVDEAKEEEIEKHFAPRRHLIAWGRVVLIVHGSTQGSFAAALWSSIFARFRVIVAKTKNVAGITLSSVRRRKLAIEGIQTMKPTVIAAAIFTALIDLVSAANLDTARIDQLTGLKGKLNEKEGVYKVTFPRNDVKVVVDGWTMPPFMGLGTWAAFTATKDGAMVMGDTVLFEDEVNATMSAALDNGLNVTALHNHFFFDHPKVYFMHIEGEGAVDKLAGAVRKVYDAAKQIRAASPNPKDSFGAAPLPEKSSITAAPLNEIFGAQGESKDGMVKFTFGRPATMHGVNIGKDMGVNTWAAFAGNDDNAVVDGDFAVTEDELQPTAKSLLKEKINIVAIHQHMTHEEPRMMFFHYWGRGRAKDLAQAIKGAIFGCGSARSHFTDPQLKLTFSSKKDCSVALLCCYAAATSNAQSAPLKLKQTIQLPGVEGRIDHFASDPSGQRLFVCALGNNSLEVIDLAKANGFIPLPVSAHLKALPTFRTVNRLFVANDRGGICKNLRRQIFPTARRNRP